MQKYIESALKYNNIQTCPFIRRDPTGSYPSREKAATDEKIHEICVYVHVHDVQLYSILV